ncbi:MAG TPA: hypothetical protein VEA41_17050 [Salinarimonas sp.]|jgi:hypothetical protein|nr:hypothetical protein [Salinarimonas sp.]
MRKRLERALRDHRDEPGAITGYLVITFRDGRAYMTGEASDGDEIAQTMIDGVREAIEAPLTGAEDDGDTIGLCLGSA